MNPKFRTLRSDEIQCRIGTISDKGLSLLLYKDARADMTILDETVGSMNWKRAHSRENANCTVSIWDEDKQQWISKEDTGTESNTEAEKGLASDSFKRACVTWGIGRELYTAPFIWVPASQCNIKEKNGRFSCYDKFEVMFIDYTPDGKISRLTIGNSTTHTVVFTTDKSKAAEAPPTRREDPPADKSGDVQMMCSECGKLIKPWMRGNEMIMDAIDVSLSAQKEFGRPLCLSCIKALKKVNENAD